MKCKTTLCVAAVAALFGTMTTGAEEKVPLATELPKAQLTGTPVPVKVPNLDPKPADAQPPLLVPAGTIILSKGKKVTSSDMQPVIGTLDLVTDGDKAGDEGCNVELGPGKQWVQIDLGARAEIAAVWVWHFHSQSRIYHDVVVQVSDDPEFVSSVTVYNNDHDNSSGLGVGKDYAYHETHKGRVIDAKGAKGRYVRLYSNGNTANRMNHYIEVEVFGKLAK